MKIGVVHAWSWGMAMCLSLMLGSLLKCGASDLDEFKVKRKEVFEFAEKPQVTRQGDRVEIAFVSKDACDVSVAIEDAQGKIVRHLVSGVLGDRAPPPLAKNALKQALLWDGKDDQGTYLDDKERLTVRVSLGLKPQFEKVLFWSPKKRYGGMPLVYAAPEGVYVYDACGADHLALFDHDGHYLRTIYPFPADKLKAVQGLKWHPFPQGYTLPLKGGPYQNTLLSSGNNFHARSYTEGMQGLAATGLAVRDNRIALAFVGLNRLATDGSTGGLPLQGPATGKVIRNVATNMDEDAGPSSLAFSPDGKQLYLTGYLWRSGSWQLVTGCVHAVTRMEYEKDAAPQVFVGSQKEDGHGADEKHFCVPSSVACDAQGRVYVSDFLNDRVQIFEPSGALVKSLPTPKPAKVVVHRKSGEIYVFSFSVLGVPNELAKSRNLDPKGIAQTLTRFSALPEARPLGTEPFPLGYGDPTGFYAQGQLYQVELDSWTEPPSIWVVGRKHQAGGQEYGFHPSYAQNEHNPALWKAGVRIQRKVDGKWKVVSQFAEDVEKEVVRVPPPHHNIQHLYVHPLTGKVYVAEADSGPTIKASNQWIEIDPETSKIRILRLPFNAMDAAFDLNGMVYLRNTDMVARYDFPSWREVPWDYGEDRPHLGNDGSINGHDTSVIAGLPMPSTSPVCYHQGGLYVSPKGHVAASCAYRYVGISSGQGAEKKAHAVEVYKPQVFPGRSVSPTTPCIHVWDKHGRLVYEDALPGSAQLDGVGLDRDDGLYVMHTPTRIHDGKPYFNEMSETLLKVRPKQAKVVCSGLSPIPLPEDQYPKRPPDEYRGAEGKLWVEGAEWQYGGVGFAGFNMKGLGGGCACWFARFTLDYFARSIAPEPDQYRVAVLDSGGNLILHIGQYGNPDSSGPGSRVPLGGDEVGLVHACFVGTHTDRRIFIGDYGNGRILSVKLAYHAQERVPLKDVPDAGKLPVK